MASGFCFAMLCGVVVKEPRFRQSADVEQEQTDFHLNVTKRVTTDGQVSFEANSIFVRVIGKMAVEAAQFKMGDRVYVEGYLDTINWPMKNAEGKPILQQEGKNRGKPRNHEMVHVRGQYIQPGPKFDRNRVIMMATAGAPASRPKDTVKFANLRMVFNQWVKVDGHEDGGYERAVWVPTMIIGKSYERALKNVGKGATLLLEGQLESRSWVDDKIGINRTSVELKCFDFKYAGGARGGNNVSPDMPPDDADWQTEGGYGQQDEEDYLSRGNAEANASYGDAEDYTGTALGTAPGGEEIPF